MRLFLVIVIAVITLVIFVAVVFGIPVLFTKAINRLVKLGCACS